MTVLIFFTEEGNIWLCGPVKAIEALYGTCNLNGFGGEGSLQQHEVVTVRDVDVPVAMILGLSPYQGGRISGAPVEVARAFGDAMHGDAVRQWQTGDRCGGIFDEVKYGDVTGETLVSDGMGVRGLNGDSQYM